MPVGAGADGVAELLGVSPLGRSEGGCDCGGCDGGGDNGEEGGCGRYDRVYCLVPMFGGIVTPYGSDGRGPSGMVIFAGVSGIVGPDGGWWWVGERGLDGTRPSWRGAGFGLR